MMIPSLSSLEQLRTLNSEMDLMSMMLCFVTLIPLADNDVDWVHYLFKFVANLTNSF